MQFLHHPTVITIQRRVALIEEATVEGRIVEEETATEIIDSLFRIGQELVGDKCHMIARLAEHLGEERLVAPRSAVTDSPEREHVLEDKACEVPRRYDIRERNKRTFLGHRQLTGCRGLVVAIELGMVLVVTLTDDKDDVRNTEDTTVHLYLVSAGNLQLFYLLVCQTIGIDSEGQTIDGQI